MTSAPATEKSPPRMLEKKSDFQVRRVVHGTGADGRSTVVEDGVAPRRLETPAFTIVDLWRFNGLPTEVDEDDGLPAEIELTPPAGSAVFRMCSIAPDEEWAGRSYEESLEAIGHDEGGDEETSDLAPGHHRTDTVDVVVQTGNAHAWSNRSTEVCKVAFVMATGTRR